MAPWVLYSFPFSSIKAIDIKEPHFSMTPLSLSPYYLSRPQISITFFPTRFSFFYLLYVYPTVVALFDYSHSLQWWWSSHGYTNKTASFFISWCRNTEQDKTHSWWLRSWHLFSAQVSKSQARAEYEKRRRWYPPGNACLSKGNDPSQGALEKQSPFSTFYSIHDIIIVRHIVEARPLCVTKTEQSRRSSAWSTAAPSSSSLLFSPHPAAPTTPSSSWKS